MDTLSMVTEEWPDNMVAPQISQLIDWTCTLFSVNISGYGSTSDTDACAIPVPDSWIQIWIYEPRSGLTNPDPDWRIQIRINEPRSGLTNSDPDSRTQIIIVVFNKDFPSMFSLRPFFTFCFVIKKNKKLLDRIQIQIQGSGVTEQDLDTDVRI